MKQYLTIGEFAKLRELDINSLRYYEKLGLLPPAWVDPKTRYRYYLPEQLVILDIISLCIHLGIPLKKLREYIDSSGAVDKKAILEDGKAAMERRISEMQVGLELVQFSLDSMEQNQEYSGRTGVYTRDIPERFLLEKPFSGDWNSLSQKENAATALFHEAQERGLAPVFPAGILIHPGAPYDQFSLFFQILHPLHQDRGILHIPAGTFSCLQTDLTPDARLPELLEKNFPERGGRLVIISNLLLNGLHFTSRHSGIQIPLDAKTVSGVRGASQRVLPWSMDTLAWNRL